VHRGVPGQRRLWHPEKKGSTWGRPARSQLAPIPARHLYRWRRHGRAGRDGSQGRGQGGKGDFMEVEYICLADISWILLRLLRAAL